MVLVVGGAGYIGSHMVKLLRDSGIAHVVLDNFSTGHRAAVAASEVLEGDLADPASLDRAFSSYPIDVVMHFAASISVGESVREPAQYWRNNVVGVFNLLESMRRAGVMHFIFSSTAAVFGEPDYVPIDEAHPKAPTSPYGQTKLAVEHMLDDFDVAYGLRSVKLRYFNAAGADPAGQIGEHHEKEEHLIPLAIQAALGQRPGLKVFGSDYPTPDGTCVRDYIHVMDLASAHLLAIDHLRAGGDSRAYNVGNGQGYSVRHVLDTVRQISARDFAIEDSERRPGDPAILVASSQAIRRDWGWTPVFPELETIVEHAWRWHRDHPNGYHE